MWEWCSCSPVGAGARAEVSNRSCGRRGTQPLPEHRQEGWEHMWKGCVCVCVCVCRHRGLSLLWLPCLLLTLTTGQAQLEDRGQGSLRDAACTGQPPGHGAGQRRVERGPRGGYRAYSAQGLTASLPSVSVSRGRTVLTDS